jgi:hypothetical protein
MRAGSSIRAALEQGFDADEIYFAEIIDRETQINELADALSWLLEELGDPACPNLPSVEAMAEAKSVIDQVKGGE